MDTLQSIPPLCGTVTYRVKKKLEGKSVQKGIKVKEGRDGHGANDVTCLYEHVKRNSTVMDNYWL